MYLEMQNRFRQMEKQQNMDKREIYELRMAAMKMRMHDTGNVFKIKESAKNWVLPLIWWPDEWLLTGRKKQEKKEKNLNEWMLHWIG
jgi:hypothetical protein